MQEWWITNAAVEKAQKEHGEWTGVGSILRSQTHVKMLRLTKIAPINFGKTSAFISVPIKNAFDLLVSTLSDNNEIHFG